MAYAFSNVAQGRDSLPRVHVASLPDGATAIVAAFSAGAACTSAGALDTSCRATTRPRIRVMFLAALTAFEYRLAPPIRTDGFCRSGPGAQSSSRRAPDGSARRTGRVVQHGSVSPAAMRRMPSRGGRRLLLGHDEVATSHQLPRRKEPSVRRRRSRPVRSPT
jgi:hypothetical protein